MSNRDQFITEKVLGECWHEWEILNSKEYQEGLELYAKWPCICGKRHLKNKLPNNDFSSAEGFFKLWNFCKEQEWWQQFINKLLKNNHASYVYEIITVLINPDVFADAIARYRGWNDERN